MLVDLQTNGRDKCKEKSFSRFGLLPESKKFFLQFRPVSLGNGEWIFGKFNLAERNHMVPAIYKQVNLCTGIFALP
jgi:hypothetical protein